MKIVLDEDALPDINFLRIALIMPINGSQWECFTVMTQAELLFALAALKDSSIYMTGLNMVQSLPMK